jgi:hypothetical protein
MKLQGEIVGRVHRDARVGILVVWARPRRPVRATVGGCDTAPLTADAW